MTAKYKVGDTVTVNERYLREGKQYFGKSLKHKKFVGEIIKVYENINNEKDGLGEVVPNIYFFKGNISICELFLKLVSKETVK